MASAELLLGPYNINKEPLESKHSPDFLQARQETISAFSQNITARGVIATSTGRFQAIFLRDAGTGESQAMEKPQNGSLQILIEGAKRTLVTTAEHQGTKFNMLTRERKGAMTHEDHGSDSDQEHLAQIAKAADGKWVSEVNGHYEGRNYRALDPTLWWMILFSDYVGKTQDFALMDQLWPNFEAAGVWLGRYGSRLLKGGLEGGKPPRNLGWKDSETAFIDEDGHFPAYPAAPLDVNAIACLADRKAADLYELKEDHKRARALRSRAEQRRELIDKLFWLGEYSVYAPAVDAFDQPVRIRTSDSAYALWAGVANGKSRQIAASMLETDLFVKGRGLRTRSTFSKQFSTADYQNGNIWYHLAPMTAAACEKLGFADEAQSYDSCIPTIVSEGFPELDCVDQGNNVFPYVEIDSRTGAKKPVGCKYFTMTIGSVLNRLAA